MPRTCIGKNFGIWAGTWYYAKNFLVWSQLMGESLANLKRTYLKEEEFPEGFSAVAMVAAGELNGAWRPNNKCDDAARKIQAYFLSTGKLKQLVFKSAAVYYNPNGFESVQILLESSKRIVNIHVRVGGKLVAVKILDWSA